MLVEVNPLIVTPERELRALDAKVTLDGNAMFRHPDNATLRNPSAEDPQEQMAKERGLTYVKLDGDIGILGNGAGLVMSTLDVVAQAGGRRRTSSTPAAARRPTRSCRGRGDPLRREGQGVLFNIFGGITRCDEVPKGLIEAFEQVQPEVPFVVRLDGTNDEEGRRLLAEADCPGLHVEATMLGAAERVVELGRHPRRWRDEHPDRQRDAPVRLGHHRSRGHVPRAEQQALRHPGRLRRHPGQGRPGRRRASRSSTRSTRPSRRPARTPRWCSCRRASPPTRSSRPPTPASDDRRHHRGHPGARRAAGRHAPQRTPACALIGPNCPGVLSPGKANVGIIPPTSSSRATSGSCRARAR